MPTAAKKAATTPAKKTTAVSEGPRVIKAGGAKGQLIVDLMKKNPSLTRAQLAEQASATTGRVGEVIRYFRDHGTAEEKKIVEAHVAAQPPRKTREKAENPTPAAAGKSAAKKAAPAKRAATPRKSAKTTQTPSAE